MVLISRVIAMALSGSDTHRKSDVDREIVHLNRIAHGVSRQRTVNKYGLLAIDLVFLGRFRKRKRPRGRRMRGLILNTAGRRSAVSVIGFWEEE